LETLFATEGMEVAIEVVDIRELSHSVNIKKALRRPRAEVLVWRVRWNG
jgi:hypothetical protein